MDHLNPHIYAVPKPCFPDRSTKKDGLEILAVAS